MINALIQNGDQTAVLNLPSNPFSLLYDLSQIGIRSRLRDIPINDDEDSTIQVKLFADSDIGSSLAVLFKPSHSLEDANLCAHMVENARPEILEELEQHIVYGQYFSPQAVTPAALTAPSSLMRSDSSSGAFCSTDTTAISRLHGAARTTARISSPTPPLRSCSYGRR